MQLNQEDRADSQGPSLDALLSGPEPEETETEETEEVVPEDENPATEEPEEETPPEDVSEPAQRRFQKLANRAKQANQENAALKQVLAQQAELISTLREDTGLRKQQWDVQQTYLKQQHQALQPEQRRRNMIMAGLDPSETFHQFMYDQWEANEALKAKIYELETKQTHFDSERNQDRFSRAVETSIRNAVSKYDVDEGMVRDLAENARDIAIAKGTDPDTAVKTTLERFSKLMKPKLTKKLTPEEKQVHSMIATSGRTGGESPGMGSRRRSKPTWEQAKAALGR